MRNILTNAIYRKHKECNGTYSIALLGNGIFYSISRDHKQPIKRSEFNKVLYKTLFTSSKGMNFSDCETKTYILTICR